MNITKEYILQNTENGLLVFEHFLGRKIQIGKSFKSTFYEDSKASCYIYYDKGSKQFKYKDFGAFDQSGDCFFIVGKILGLNCELKSEFIEILNTIGRELFLDHRQQQASTIASSKPTESKYASIVLKDAPILIKSFNERELAYWGSFGIGLDVLERFHVVSIASVTGIGKEDKPFTITSKLSEPIFGYTGQRHTKVYRPCSRFRFLFIGHKPEQYVFGYDQLPLRGDILFITGGEKDVLSLSAKGFNAISLNSETANIPTKVFTSLAFRFKHMVVLYDTDSTGISSMERLKKEGKEFNLKSLTLPLSGEKGEKDISDFFKRGNTAEELLILFREMLDELYDSTIAIMNTCEINFDKPPIAPEPLLKIKDVCIGTPGNIVCVTGSEGSGKTNYLGGVLSGAIRNENAIIDTLGTTVQLNSMKKAVILYDTEQSEFQLYKNMTYLLDRSELKQPPRWFKGYCLVGISRNDRMNLILESMDRMYYEHGGIHMVIIDGIADLLAGVNDEEASVRLVEELFRISAIYNTVILCVLHMSPSGFKLRGHLGSEVQRKSAGILLVEKDDSENFSIVKALKVRDGSPIDVPTTKFGWDSELGRHVYMGEISKSAKNAQKLADLRTIVEELFKDKEYVSTKIVSNHLQTVLEVQDRTARKYISLLIEGEILVKSPQFPSELRLKQD